MSEYTIFTKPTCKYCVVAKNTLFERGHTFKEFDIEATPALRMMVKMAGFNTVPVIFCEEGLLGGYEDLLDYLEREEEPVNAPD